MAQRPQIVLTIPDCIHKPTTNFPETLTGPQLVIKLAFHPTRKLSTASHKPPVPNLSHTDTVHASHPTSRRSILILSSHLRLGLPNGFLPFGFSTKTLHAPLLAPIRALCPAHLKLPVMQSSLLPYYLVPLRSKSSSALYSRKPSAYDPPSM